MISLDFFPDIWCNAHLIRIMLTKRKNKQTKSSPPWIYWSIWVHIINPALAVYAFDISWVLRP